MALPTARCAARAWGIHLRMSGRRRTRTIGIVGTFDVANFGDLLFPYLAEDALRRRLGPIDLRRYSIRPMAAPPWTYVVRPIDELLEHVDQLELLIVGGGHLVRFDQDVAPQYQPTSGGIPLPTGYWLTPTLAAATAGVPVAWNALGVSRTRHHGRDRSSRTPSTPCPTPRSVTLRRSRSSRGRADGRRAPRARQRARRRHPPVVDHGRRPRRLRAGRRTSSSRPQLRCARTPNGSPTPSLPQPTRAASSTSCRCRRCSGTGSARSCPSPAPCRSTRGPIPWRSHV